MVAGEYPLILAYNQTIQRMTSRGAPIEWLPLEPAVTQVNPVMLASKAPRPNAARLFYDFVLSKEGQEMLRGFQRIPVRKDVEPDPPRLFRGFKIAVEDPEEYKDFDGSVKQYLEIFNYVKKTFRVGSAKFCAATQGCGSQRHSIEWVF